MKTDRFTELMKDQTLDLTTDEKQEGWLFCICEWDGLLIHKWHPEGTICTCLRDRGQTWGRQK